VGFRHEFRHGAGPTSESTSDEVVHGYIDTMGGVVNEYVKKTRCYPTRKKSIKYPRGVRWSGRYTATIVPTGYLFEGVHGGHTQAACETARRR